MTVRGKVVILGMLTKIPVGGVMWLVGQYAEGFRRLGFDVYYVEAHGRTPSMFMESASDDGVAKACAFLDATLSRFGLARKWAYHAVHDTNSCYGMSRQELQRLYAEAALIINLHGGTEPLDEHSATGRLVYMGTDPVDVEIELANGVQRTIEYLEPHVAFFTWGLNYGNADCTLPWSERFVFRPVPPPVVPEFWDGGPGPGPNFTTIGNWRQEYRDLVVNGQRFSWSKRDEFIKILELPSRIRHPVELALSSCSDEDRHLLETNGWRVRPALPFSADLDQYRNFIRNSRGEFSVAKQQNVSFRTGWFSERSATYLAAARPVILQDTGYSSALPCGEGLLAFTDLGGAVDAMESITSSYDRHSRAAREIALEYLAYHIVLPPVLEAVGLSGTRRTPTRDPGPGSPPNTDSSTVPTATERDGCGVVFSYRVPERDDTLTINLRGLRDDHIMNVISRTGSFYEQDLLDHLARVAPRGGTFLDVGANIGNHSVFFGKVLGVGVVAVEPNPIVIPFLKRNLMVNHVRAVVVRSALADHAGHGVMVLDAEFQQNIGATRIEPAAAPGDSTCCITTVDELLDDLEEWTPVTLIKVDVEGMEADVIQGAQRLLKEHRPDVVVEASGDGAHTRVIEMLSPLGYAEIGQFCATSTYHYRAGRQ